MARWTGCGNYRRAATDQSRADVERRHRLAATGSSRGAEEWEAAVANDQDFEKAVPETDEVWRRVEPDSPCVKICMIHPTTGYCVGCGRTGDEIAAWPTMSAEARRALTAELPARMTGPGPEDRPTARRRRRRDTTNAR